MPEPEGTTPPVPFLEAFLMAEDIRFEKSGQFSLIGLFSDIVYSRLWPLQFPKICFEVRVRDLEGSPVHRLVVVRLDKAMEMATLEGPSPNGEGSTRIYNYFFSPGLAFPEPGRYAAKFSLCNGEETVFRAEYAFAFLNPNPDELYVDCSTCKFKYASGLALSGSSRVEGCGCVCPRCGSTNPLDSRTASRLPNP